jgi:hypothetical protein
VIEPVQRPVRTVRDPERNDRLVACHVPVGGGGCDGCRHGAGSVNTLRELLAEVEETSSAPIPTGDDLPVGVSVSPRIESVISPRTIQGVSDRLDLDRENALAALGTLESPDLVQGRLDVTMAPEERDRRVAERTEEMTADQVRSRSPQVRSDDE